MEAGVVSSQTVFWLSGGIMTFTAGQCWRYLPPQGFEHSRIIVGAIASFSSDARILCCAVLAAPERQPDGTCAAVTIPFLPISEAAFRQTVTRLDDDAAMALPDGFVAALEAWRSDPKGLSCFTVAFDGFMDRMIARQMAQIVGTDAA